MCADATPDDVPLAGADCVAVLEEGAAIRSPCYLPKLFTASKALHAQAWAGRTMAEIVDEFGDSGEEERLL